jgi:hypothetical protein
MLGEKLGDGRKGGPADLLAAFVNLVLLLALPELINPAQPIVGGKDGGRQPGQDFLQSVTTFRGKPHLGSRFIAPENTGQHQGRVTSRQHPGIFAATFFGGDLGALGQGDGHTFGVHQKLIFGQKTRKKHPMPLLISDFFHQQLLPGLKIVTPKLASFGPQTIAKLALLGAHRAESIGLTHRESTQNRAGRVFGFITGIDNGFFQVAT